VVQQILGMGFSENAAKRACKAVDGAGAEAAATWIFGHMDDADLNDPLPVEPAATAAEAVEPVALDTSGPGQYTLLAIISHLGKTTGGGHYVCHIKKEGKWAIFNDRKVGQSKAPPLDVGYLYIYARNT
jgi:ubiquitin carboxyl-terminal hydrolase 5/13